MARSTTRIAVESALVLALAIGAWRVLRQPEPAPLPPPAPVAETAKGPREDRIGSLMSQRKAERAAEKAAALAAKKVLPDPEKAFKVEPTAPAPGMINLDKPEGTLTGELVDDQGNLVPIQALVFSEGGGFTLPVTGGKFVGTAKPGDWQAYAQYKEGLEIRRVGPFTMHVQAGPNPAFTIVVPAVPKVAGPGFTWIHRGDFLEVQAITEGSAAAQAGLATGDAITEIGGKTVKELDAVAAEAALQGPPGSVFRLKVVADTGNGLHETVVDLLRPAGP